jgi:hypothetical protein
MKKLRIYLVHALIGLMIFNCSGDDETQFSCLLSPCGTITTNEINLAVSIAKIDSIISDVILVLDGQEVALTTDGFDPANTITYSCWETVPSTNVQRVKFTMNETAYDLEVANGADTKLVVLEIVELDNSLTANLADYVECNDNPSS